MRYQTFKRYKKDLLENLDDQKQEIMEDESLAVEEHISEIIDGMLPDDKDEILTILNDDPALVGWEPNAGLDFGKSVRAVIQEVMYEKLHQWAIEWANENKLV